MSVITKIKTDKLKNFLGNENYNYLRQAFYLALVIRIALFISTYFIGSMKFEKPIGEIFYIAMTNWDSHSFLYLAEHWYTNTGDQRNYLAYLPLYPTLIKVFSVFFKNYLLSAVLLSFCCSVFAGFYLQKLVSLDNSEPDYISKVLYYFFLFPTAYFLALPYSDSLFIFLTIACIYHARSRQLTASVIFAAFACMTKLQGLALLPVLLIELWLNRKDYKLYHVFWLLLPPLGIAVHMLINWKITGNFLEFLDIQKSNFSHTGHILPTKQIWDTVKNIINGPPSANRAFIDEARLIAIILTTSVLLFSVKRMRVSYQFFAWSQFLILLTDVWLISLPRYCLAFFPLYIGLADIFKKKEFYNYSLIISGMVMVTFHIVFSMGRWAF